MREDKRRLFFGCILAGLALLCLDHALYAIDPDRAISQYEREEWGTERGFPGGSVYSIAQTADGYLWIGTEKGLVSFDGLNFHLIQHSDAPSLPAGPVLGLTTDANGDLWIRMRSPSILRYRNGKFEDLLTSLERVEPRVTAMNRGKNNEVLLSTLRNGTLKFDGNEIITLSPSEQLPSSIVISIAETSAGDVWMGTRDAGLYRLSGQHTSAMLDGLPDRKINCLLPDGDQGLLIGTDKGIIRWSGNELSNSGIPADLNHAQIFTMLKDRDSNIWIGAGSRNLFRLNASGLVSMENPHQVSGGAVTALFEDREGNVWIGSDLGIERLRDSAFKTYSTNEGLPSESSGPIYVDSASRSWFAPIGGGLYWLKGNEIKGVTGEGLSQDVIYSITGGKDNLWVGRQHGGLTHLHFSGTSIQTKTYRQADGLAQNSVYAVYQTRDGTTVWAGTLSGGASEFKNGKFTNYTTASGLISNSITAIAESSDRTMWFATPSGLSSLSQNQWHSYTMRDGLPSESVNCLLTDSAGALWIGTAKGLAFLDSSGRIRFPPTMPASLNESIMGLAEDQNGALWITTSNHLLQIPRAKLLQSAISESDLREYGIADGLKGTEGVKRYRSVVTDPAGQIWFSLNRGLSVADPRRLKNYNSAPSLVQIQNVSVDGVPINLQNTARIPPGRQRFAFNYAGLSLSVPERVRFRYWLEGFDHDWSSPVAAREAVYTNLGPGSYRFHVVASNSDGLWNSAEAALAFEIEPIFWQTWWFRVICGVSLILMISGLYRLRLYYLTRQLNIRFEERLGERTRIAQDLHDTLLQGFLSASMQLYVADELLAADSPAKPLIQRVLKLMGQVTEEGRNAVRGLRSPENSGSSNLEQAFSIILQDLIGEQQIDSHVFVKGSPRPIHPIIRDEIYWIGREALINACRHSQARMIEVEIEYALRYFQILIRDNGCGIDSGTLSTGREGHWGLAGMHERAELIGATLKVWSRAGAGTEIELSVPNHLAFETQAGNHLLGWLPKWPERKTRPEREKRSRDK